MLKRMLISCNATFVSTAVRLSQIKGKRVAPFRAIVLSKNRKRPAHFWVSLSLMGVNIIQCILFVHA